MTDLELITLASKASGFEYTNSSNPLISDKLALRLAVKLCIRIETYDDWADASTNFAFGRCSEKIINDPYEATRRAIVRAAAEIGKTMKGGAA